MEDITILAWMMDDWMQHADVQVKNLQSLLWVMWCLIFDYFFHVVSWRFFFSLG